MSLEINEKEKKAERNRIYRENNKEKTLEYNKLYYNSNIEKERERFRLYSKANREKRNEAARLYRAENKEYVRESREFSRRRRRIKTETLIVVHKICKAQSCDSAINSNSHLTKYCSDTCRNKANKDYHRNRRLKIKEELGKK